MKDTIIVKVPKEIKEKIMKKAKEKNLTISAYIRMIFTEMK